MLRLLSPIAGYALVFEYCWGLRVLEQRVQLYVSTAALTESSSIKSICLQTLKVGANDRSSQELQNGL
jgi:hypothetical protein